MTEAFVVVLVFCGMLLMLPVVFWLAHKVISFAGDKFHLFKKYCVKGGKRMGREQLEKSRGALNMRLYRVALLFWLPFGLLMMLLDRWLDSNVFACLGWASGTAMIVYVIFMELQIERYCLFCSEQREDVELHIAEKCLKNQFYREMVTEIVFEDGLYMIFARKPEDIRTAMEEYVKVYTREYPDCRTKLLSKKWFWLLFAPLAVVAVGVFFMAKKVLGLPGDWPVFLESLVLLVPYAIWWFQKDLFVRECIKKLREEEKLSKEKYAVLSVRLDKNDSRKVVFRVRERTVEEQERMLRR